MTRGRGLALVVALAAAAPAVAQPETPVALYIGPLPNPAGVVTPVPDGFAKSYADLQKAHDKAHPGGIVLATDAAHADAILTVTFRGSVDAGATIGISRMMGGGESLSSAQHDMRTLRAR